MKKQEVTNLVLLFSTLLKVALAITLILAFASCTYQTCPTYSHTIPVDKNPKKTHNREAIVRLNQETAAHRN